MDTTAANTWKRVLRWGALAPALLAGALVAAPPVPQLSQVWTAKVGVHQFEWADFNHDGRLDLLIGPSAANASPQIYTNDGSDGFNLYWTFNGRTAGGIVVTAADFNGDGWADLAFSQFSTPGQIYVMRNLRNGLFTPSLLVDSGTYSVNRLAFADLDGDGLPDFVISGQITTSTPGTTSFYRNTGTNSFAATTLSLPGSWSFCAPNVGPHNLASFFLGFTDASAIYKNHGNFNFSQLSALATDHVYDSVFTDMDGDGLPDLVMGSGNPHQSPSITVLKNAGNDQYQAGWDSGETYQYNTASISVGDYDGDGLPDIAAATTSPNEIRVFHNDGGMQFSLALTLTMTAAPTSVRWGDYDGDGAVDLAFGTVGNISVLRNLRLQVPTATASPTATGTSSPTATPSITSALGWPTASGTPTSTDVQSPTATPTVTFTFTDVQSPTVTPTVTSTFTDVQSQTATPTVTSTFTDVQSPTVTPTVTSTFTDVQSPTATPTVTSTFTDVQSPTATPTVTPTFTDVQSATATPTATPTFTDVQSATATPTGTATGTGTSTKSPSASATASPSSTLSASPSRTATVPATPTGSATRTASFTVTRTATRSPSPAPTATRTRTATPTATATRSATRTRTPAATATRTPALTATRTPTRSPTSPAAKKAVRGIKGQGPALVLAPNPAHGWVRLRYGLENAAPSRAVLYDLGGHLARTWNLGDQAAGGGEAVLDLSGLAPGLYFLDLQALGSSAPGSLGLAKLAVTR